MRKKKNIYFYTTLILLFVVICLVGYIVYDKITNDDEIIEREEPTAPNKELVKDLRRHHFDFGKDNPQLFSVNELAYQDPSGSHQLKPTIDSQLLRQSHWS